MLNGFGSRLGHRKGFLLDHGHLDFDRGRAVRESIEGTHIGHSQDCIRTTLATANQLSGYDSIGALSFDCFHISVKRYDVDRRARVIDKRD